MLLITVVITALNLYLLYDTFTGWAGHDRQGH